MAARRRLDLDLVRRGLAAGREDARAVIADGRVRVGGSIATNASRLVDPGEPVVISDPPPPFVSRGGEKLAAALDRFGIDPAGLRVIDVGASTGGFTDCVLQRGASRVVAIDVGHGQLDSRLRGDPRVDVRERADVRHVAVDEIGGPGSLVVVDVSFVSLRSVLPALVRCTEPTGDLVVLVKPQFEADHRTVSRGRGVVRDPEVWSTVLEQVIAEAAAAGATVVGAMASPITGAKGNVEFLAHIVPAPAGRVPYDPGELPTLVAGARDTGP